ncbi:KilA-N domain-containing protein [Oscillospiraceae bacterium 21-37]
MERASQSELLWAYAITRDEYAKRLSEKSLIKTEDLEFIRDRIFELINRGEANIHDPKEKQQLQAVVEKYLYPEADYISLTDIAKRFDSENPSYVIQSWLRSRNTIAFLGQWERENNPNFDEQAFQQLLVDVRSPAYTLTPARWIERVNAVGIISRRGKNGGTTAHPFIACDFEMWNDVTFRYKVFEHIYSAVTDLN